MASPSPPVAIKKSKRNANIPRGSPITSIKNTGIFHEHLRFTVEKSEFVPKREGKPEYSKFLFNNDKKSKIEGISFGDRAWKNYESLKEGFKYVIRGSITVVKRCKDFQSLSTSKFELKIGKIRIFRETKKRIVRQVRKKTNLQQVAARLLKGKPFCVELKNVVIDDGQLYRYMGCEICCTGIRFPETDGKFYCTRCSKSSGEKMRKICMVIRNIKLKDAVGNVLENVVCFNQECEKLIGKPADAFCHDLEAKSIFANFIGAEANITFCAQKSSSNLPAFENVLNRIAKSISIISTTNIVSPEGKENQIEVLYKDSPRDQCSEEDIDFICSKLEDFTVEVLQPDNQRKDTKIDAYEVKSKPSGLALIINNYNFPYKEGEKQRIGSKNDIRKIQSLLKQLNYEIFEKVFEDIESTNLTGIICDFKEALIEEKVDSFIFVIMSHGNTHEIEMVDNKNINLYWDVISYFTEEKFSDFSGKPKIFIVEACQDFALSPHSLHYVVEQYSFKDILLCLPSLPGYTAYRRTNSGSIFIHFLVRVFMLNARDMDIGKMLDKVQREMHEFTENRKRKQLPHYMSFLFNTFYFPFGN